MDIVLTVYSAHRFSFSYPLIVCYFCSNGFSLIRLLSLACQLTAPVIESRKRPTLSLSFLQKCDTDTIASTQSQAKSMTVDFGGVNNNAFWMFLNNVHRMAGFEVCFCVLH